MAKSLLAGGPGFFGRLAGIRGLTASRELPNIEESSRLTAEHPSALNVQEIQAERLDAIAGSEFVDDRIRLRE
jgi:hypothetical protein